MGAIVAPDRACGLRKPLLDRAGPGGLVGRRGWRCGGWRIGDRHCCDGRLDAWLLCLSDALTQTNCQPAEDACVALEESYWSCITSKEDCVSAWCDATVCTCGGCGNGEQELIAQCDGFGDSNCECFWGTTSIGSCQGTTCEIEGSCCRDLYFKTF